MDTLYLKRWTPIEGIVLVGAELGVTNIWFQSFIVRLELVVTDDTITSAQLS